MSIRQIERIISPPAHHFVGDGFRVHNFIPSVIEMSRMNPFIMLDYNSKHYFSPTDTPRGVDVHPHRGFETVTIAYNGKVAHHDSSGGGGVIEEGDVQWMTAASGVLHKEYHEEEFSKQGGYFQMVQLWVNLPAKFKMTAPKYQALDNEVIPKVNIGNDGSVIEIIAGNYNNVEGAASTHSPIDMFNIKLKHEATLTLQSQAQYNTILLVIEGSIKANGSIVNTDNMVLFTNDGEQIDIECTEEAIVLYLSGAPINEPIAAHGPFVMNTREEILQAFHDYNNGKFGYLD